MSNDVFQIGNLIGCVLQPLYLCLFMLFVKNIKEKRLIFIFLSIIDYIIIQNIVKFNISVNADLVYIVFFYINIKTLDKEKARITDIITYIVSFLSMGIFSMIYVSILGFKIITIIVTFLTLILIMLLLKDKLYAIEQFYNKFWNKHNFKFMKSVTIRGFSATLTIITFVILHIWLIYGIL
jgi:hypothetical protein